MKINEEIDAMRTIGLDPMDTLVLPRILALMITLPLLTFYADVLGLLGGAIMATIHARYQHVPIRPPDQRRRCRFPTSSSA